jgi:plasmid stability protein
MIYVYHMTTMIQIRNVPDALHRRLQSRAALAGMSLSDYLLGLIREVAARPTIAELRERLATLQSDNVHIAPRRRPCRTRSRVIVIDASALLEALLHRLMADAIVRPAPRSRQGN